MTLRRVVHFLALVLLTAIIGLSPLFLSQGGRDFLSSHIAGSVDGISSASVILDSPSGFFYVLINKERHGEDKLKQWQSYFDGEPIPFIFDDLNCSVSLSDPKALDLAKSYQSRLPENQMTVRTVDSTLFLSRLEEGQLDVMILSKEYADQMSPSVNWKESIYVVPVRGQVS